MIDGDTLIVDEDRIRLIDIDAPELGTEIGEKAKWAMIDLAYDEWVSLECNGVDVYGRKLCLVFVDGVSVSQTMLDSGLAREWR